MAATDEERLLVRIEAQLRQFERAMQQATGGADRAARRIETRFRTMERNLNTVGVGIARSILGPLAALASARGIGQAADAFTRIQNSLKVAGLEGEEMTAVFERLFQVAQKNAAPVEALAELYGKVALVQKDLNITSQELEHFVEGVATALRVQGRSAAETSGALLQLTQLLGGARVEAQEFNSILDGAPIIAQTVARGLEEAGGSVAKLRNLVREGQVSSEAFFRAFEAGQGQLESLAETTDITLGGAFTRLQNNLIASVGAFDETYNVSGTLAEGLGDVGEAIEALIRFLNSLAQPIEDIDARFRSWTNSINEFVESLPGAGVLGEALGISDADSKRIADAALTADAMRTDLELAAALRKKAAAEGDLIAGPAVAPRPVSINDFARPPARGGAGTGGRGRRSPAENFAEDIRGIQARTAALNIETQAVGKSTFEAERLLAVQDLLNEAKRAGVVITPQLRAEIEAEAAAFAAAASTLELTEDRFRAINDLAQEFGSQAIDAFEGLIDGTSTLNESLAESVKQIRRMVLEALLLGQGPLATLFGGGGGGGGGGLLSKLFGGFFASGGTLGAGKWGIAGERGPEVIRGPAHVVPMGGAGAPVRIEIRTVSEPSPLLLTGIDARVRAGNAQIVKAMPGILADQRARGL